jgi:regulatory protein
VPFLTSLEPEPRSGGVRLRLDDEAFATVSVSDVADLRLVLGAALDQRTLLLLGRRAEAFAARQVALRTLAARALPSRELVRRLMRKGHGREVAEAAVQQLVAQGIVNDAEFARQFARSRSSRRRVGPVRLARELQRFGISSSDAETAVHEALAADGIDVLALLRDAAARKQRSLSGKDPRAARRSLRAYLLRQGFPSSDVAAFLRNNNRG